MNFEKPPTTPVRETLASSLRSEPDHTKRKEILREAKVSGMKAYETGDRMQTEYREQKKYKDLVGSANTLDELKARIAESSLSILNEFSGQDHSEHVLKRIDMAEQLHMNSIILGDLDTRDRVGVLIQAESNERQHMSYVDYLEERIETSSLSHDDIFRASKKIPPELFATIDIAIEKLVLVFNSIPGIRTEYSCAGHKKDEGLGPNSIDITLHADAGSENRLQAILDALNNSYEEFEPSIRWITKGSAVIYFRNDVSDEWIRENSAPSKQEIFDESKRRIYDITKYARILNATRRDYFDLVKEAQEHYLMRDPKATTIPFAHKTRLLANIYQATTYNLESRAYDEHDYSDDMFAKRDRLIEHLIEQVASVKNKIEPRGS